MKREMLTIVVILLLTFIVKVSSVYAGGMSDDYEYTSSLLLEEVSKTEYKEVRYEVVAILSLETANFRVLTMDAAKAIADARVTYLRSYDFPTDRSGFIKALRSVPGTGKPYAKDHDYVRKVKSIARRLRKM